MTRTDPPDYRTICEDCPHFRAVEGEEWVGACMRDVIIGFTALFFVHSDDEACDYRMEELA